MRASVMITFSHASDWAAGAVLALHFAHAVGELVADRNRREGNAAPQRLADANHVWIHALLLRGEPAARARRCQELVDQQKNASRADHAV